MSKVEMKMYTLKCDNCGELFSDDHSGICGWKDFEGAKENAIDSEWIEDEKLIDVHYRPDCYYFNDDDVLTLKNT